MEWLNEPASWQRTGDVLTVSVDPGTDFWRETGYGYVRDSGHVYGDVLGGDLDVSVRLRCSLGAQYDQAGVMLRADERTWLKTGVEFFEGRARLSTVLTLGRSSWMVTDLPEGTDDIVLRVSRRGDAVEVRYVIGDGPAELAALVFLPPGREVLAGVMAAAPEGPGFRVTFQDLWITACDWSAAGGDDPSWQDDPAGWVGGEAPAWSPAEGGPGWPVPGTGEDAPDWPTAAAEGVTPPSPTPPAGDEDAEWEAPAGEEGEPGWAAGTAADDPGWPAAEAGAGEPGWPAAEVGAGEPGWPGGGAEDEEPGLAPVAEGPDGKERAAEADAASDDAPEVRPAAGGPPDGSAEPAPVLARGGTPLTGDIPDPDGTEPPAGLPPGSSVTGPWPGSAGAAGDKAKPEPVGQEPAGQEDSGQEHAGPEDAGQEHGGQEHGGQEDGGRGPWSLAPVTGHEDWARPGSGIPAVVDPAADWEQLAAGVQAARAEAAGTLAPRWRAQADAEVAKEWPGPPLRTAMRNGLLGGDAAPGYVGGDAADDAQTDPGLPRPRTADPAEAGPGQPEANTGPAAAGAKGAGTNSAGAQGAGAKSSAPGQGEPAPPARETRRSRSKRDAADQPTEPDAADEWISLLTADPVEE